MNKAFFVLSLTVLALAHEVGGGVLAKHADAVAPRNEPVGLSGDAAIDALLAHVTQDEVSAESTASGACACGQELQSDSPATGALARLFERWRRHEPNVRLTLRGD